MNEIHWVLAANASVWLGLGAYIFFMAKTQCDLNKRIAQMENLKNQEGKE